MDKSRSILNSNNDECEAISLWSYVVDFARGYFSIIGLVTFFFHFFQVDFATFGVVILFVAAFVGAYCALDTFAVEQQRRLTKTEFKWLRLTSILSALIIQLILASIMLFTQTDFVIQHAIVVITAILIILVVTCWSNFLAYQTLQKLIKVN